MMYRSFFKKHISRKHGQKWCPWGQNGKPLRKETVQGYLESLGKSDFDNDVQLWKPNEEQTRLFALFYIENIFSWVSFIQDLYNIDSEVTRQIPSVHIIDQDVFKIELHTPKLKGLSYKDLELANIIQEFNFDQYKLTPMNDVKEVRKIKREQQIAAESAQMQDEISQTAFKFGSSKFKKDN